MFVKVIPQSHCMIVERFGKPVRVVYGGLHFFIPFIDSGKSVREHFVASIKAVSDENIGGLAYDPHDPRLIELSEQMLDTQQHTYFTKDNIPMTVDCALRWRITDPIKAVYEVDQLQNSLILTTLSEMRSYVGAHELNHILSNRQSISEHMNATLAETARNWGVNVIGVEVKELTADETTVDLMRKQLEASREAEAMRLQADGRAEAELKLAEAHARALQLKADSESNYLNMLAGAVGKEGAVKIILANKVLDAYQAIAKEPAHKVFLQMPERMSMLLDDMKVPDERRAE